MGSMVTAGLSSRRTPFAARGQCLGPPSRSDPRVFGYGSLGSNVRSNGGELLWPNASNVE